LVQIIAIQNLLFKRFATNSARNFKKKLAIVSAFFLCSVPIFIESYQKAEGKDPMKP
jgi:hypothetical protein